MFECISDGSYVDIRHVSLEPASGLESETAYTGPVFAELDNELQSAFREYIQVSSRQNAVAMHVMQQRCR